MSIDSSLKRIFIVKNTKEKMEKTDFKRMRQFYAKTFEKLRKFENGQFFLCHGMADLNRWYSALEWPPPKT
jgi:RAB protein geranylgeranyltransferase component A